MKKITAIFILGCAFLGWKMIETNIPATPYKLQAFSQTNLPADAFQSCTVNQEMLSHWFVSGHATQTGLYCPLMVFDFSIKATAIFINGRSKCFYGLPRLVKRRMALALLC